MSLVRCQVSLVMCHVSHIRWHGSSAMCKVSTVRFQVSCVSCEISEKATAGDTDLEQEPVVLPIGKYVQNRPRSNVAMA